MTRLQPLRNCLVICVLMLMVETHLWACPEIEYKCIAFAESKAVFTGKLIKTELDKAREIVAYFDVSNIFKGSPQKVEILRFKNTECAPDLIIGEAYLVYQEAGAVQTLYNRTGQLSTLLTDLKYLRGVRKNSLRTIEGIVTGGEPKERIVGSVNIRHKSGNFRTKIDRFGRFNAQLRRGRYTVTIRFPRTINITVRAGPVVLTETVRVTRQKNATILEYDVDLEKNICDVREIGLSP